MKKSAWKILIEGLQVPTFVGVPEEERQQLQIIAIDIICGVQLAPYVQDDLACTIDYAALTKLVQVVCLERPRLLLETLAQDLVQQIFDFDLRIEQIFVRLRKPKKLPELEALGVQLDVFRTRSHIDHVQVKPQDQKFRRKILKK